MTTDIVTASQNGRSSGPPGSAGGNKNQITQTARMIRMPNIQSHMVGLDFDGLQRASQVFSREIAPAEKELQHGSGRSPTLAQQETGDRKHETGNSRYRRSPDASSLHCSLSASRALPRAAGERSLASRR